MADYKAYYDKRREGIDPSAFFPEAFLAEEVIPEEKQKRGMFLPLHPRLAM